MGTSNSKNTEEQARESLNEHLEYLQMFKGQILFRSTWENDYFYVISYSRDNNIISDIYKKKLLYNNCESDDNQECAICLDSIKYKACKIDGCNHMFHKKCLDKYVKMNTNACCPICRGGNDQYKISQMIDTHSNHSSNSYSSYDSN